MSCGAIKTWIIDRYNIQYSVIGRDLKFIYFFKI